MKLDLAALDPAPTTMVANLPYSVATPLILRTIAELPSLERWTVMVQREIAERLRGPSRARARTASPSVLAQLACEVRMLRTVDPGRVQPAAARRLGARWRCGAAGRRRRPSAAQLIRDAFAHRRKALPRSLELAVRGASARPSSRGCRRRGRARRRSASRAARRSRRSGCPRTSGPRC